VRENTSVAPSVRFGGGRTARSVNQELRTCLQVLNFKTWITMFVATRKERATWRERMIVDKFMLTAGHSAWQPPPPAATSTVAAVIRILIRCSGVGTGKPAFDLEYGGGGPPPPPPPLHWHRAACETAHGGGAGEQPVRRRVAPAPKVRGELAGSEIRTVAASMKLGL
jgi:hypothetical protein